MAIEINVAMIAAAVSVGALIWNLATARFARKLVLSAEETAKRGELLRLHGLNAVDELLDAVSEMTGAVGSLLFLKRHGTVLEDPAKPETQKQIKKIGEERSKIAKVRIKSAPYLDAELITEVDKVLAKTDILKFDQVEVIEADLKAFIDKAAEYARTKYLA